MKKFLNFLFNFFWVLIVGISSAISSAVMGVACMVSIVGIPFGLQHFKFIPLVFAPAGKVVVTRYSKHPVMNTFWLIFGGLPLFIFYYVLSLVLFVTIIGIPLSLQLQKIAVFNLAPFGAEVLSEDEYSSYGDTQHDLKLLFRHIIATPDKVVTDAEGNSKTAREYVAEKRQEYNAWVDKHKFWLLTYTPLIFSGIVWALLFVLYRFFGISDVLVITLFVGGLMISVIYVIVRIRIVTKKIASLYKELEVFYPNGTELYTAKFSFSDDPAVQLAACCKLIGL